MSQMRSRASARMTKRFTSATAPRASLTAAPSNVECGIDAAQGMFPPRSGLLRIEPGAGWFGHRV
jgi:hypothetical protein